MRGRVTPRGRLNSDLDLQNSCEPERQYDRKLETNVLCGMLLYAKTKVRPTT
ncbi:MAG: hypothetical protein MJE68_22495 [Proteobacteria bacterium]|nr:hypothetical protein [Pseudomonadota bacterium]